MRDTTNFIVRNIENFAAKISPKLRSANARSAVGTIAIRAGNIVLGFLQSVVLARILGVDQYGLFAFLFAIANLLVVPTQFGLPALVVRETASSIARNQWVGARSILYWSGAMSIVMSVIIAFVACVVLWVNQAGFPIRTTRAFMVVLVFIPILSLNKLRSAALQGMGFVVRGVLPDQIIKPTLVILSLLICGVLGYHVDALFALSLLVIATIIAFIVGGSYLRTLTPRFARYKLAALRFEHQRWLSSVLPFALIGGINVLNTQVDVLMLGWLGSTADVAYYQVAAKGASLGFVFLLAISQFAAPRFAALHANKDMEALERAAVSVSRYSFALAFPVALCLVALGGPILRLTYGSEYESAATPLLILVIFQLVSTIFGPAETLLGMTGYEKIAMRWLAAAAVMNVIMNAALIPVMGMSGAALATGLTIVTRRWVLGFQVKKALKLRCALRLNE